MFHRGNNPGADQLMPERGHILHQPNRPAILVTIHPSYLLRIRDEAEECRRRRDFVSDLHKTKAFLLK